jgi:hypothetical protein
MSLRLLWALNIKTSKVIYLFIGCMENRGVIAYNMTDLKSKKLLWLQIHFIHSVFSI